MPKRERCAVDSSRQTFPAYGTEVLTPSVVSPTIRSRRGTFCTFAHITGKKSTRRFCACSHITQQECAARSVRLRTHVGKKQICGVFATPAPLSSYRDAVMCGDAHTARNGENRPASILVSRLPTHTTGATIGDAANGPSVVHRPDGCMELGVLPTEWRCVHLAAQGIRLHEEQRMNAQ